MPIALMRLAEYVCLPLLCVGISACKANDDAANAQSDSGGVRAAEQAAAVCPAEGFENVLQSIEQRITALENASSHTAGEGELPAGSFALSGGAEGTDQLQRLDVLQGRLSRLHPSPSVAGISGELNGLTLCSGRIGGRSYDRTEGGVRLIGMTLPPDWLGTQGAGEFRLSVNSVGVDSSCRSSEESACLNEKTKASDNRASESQTIYARSGRSCASPLHLYYFFLNSRETCTFQSLGNFLGRTNTWTCSGRTIIACSRDDLGGGTALHGGDE